MDDPAWQSPFHRGGVRSPSLFGGHVGSKLTEKKIHQYALEGRYGADAYERAMLAEGNKKRCKN